MASLQMKARLPLTPGVRPKAPGPANGRWDLEVIYKLVIPLPAKAGPTLQVVGALCGIAGLAIWLEMANGSWQSLGGAVALNLGGTLWLLGWVAGALHGQMPLNPLTVLLVCYAARRALGLAYVIGEGSDLVSPFFAVPTANYIESSAKAEIVTLFGTAAFLIGWQLARGRSKAVMPIMETGRWQARHLWLCYIFGLVVFLGQLFAPLTVAKGGALLSSLVNLAFGAAFALLAFNDRFGVERPGQWAVFVALLALMANVPFSGMKSFFFFALLPVGAAFALKRPSKTFILAIVAAISLLLFVYPYVEDFRKANWGRASSITRPGEIARGVMTDVGIDGVSKSASNSLGLLKQRLGSVSEAGAVVYFADRTGSLGLSFLKTLPYAFVPRFLWPDKPSWDPAQWFTAFLGEFEYVEGDNPSSTALHLATELYWMLGWPATFTGMMLLGIYHRRISDLLLRRGAGSPSFLAGWYAMVLVAISAEELRFTMMLVTPAIVLADTYVVSWLIGAIVPKIRKRSLRTQRMGSRATRPLPDWASAGEAAHVTRVPVCAREG